MPAICSGFTGMRVRGWPVASRRAATMAGVGEVVGGSPTPLRPEGGSGAEGPRGVARGRDYGGGGGDSGRFPDALEAVGGLRVRELQDLHLYRGHVQDGGEEVVRERGVKDLAVFYLDLLQQRKPQALRYAALDLAFERLRVHDLPHVLRRRDLHDPHEPELRVYLDDRPVRRERELQVRVPLPFLVQRVGLPMVVLEGLLEPLRPDQVGQGDHGPPVGKDLVPVQGEAAIFVKLFPDPLEDPLPDRFAGALDGGAGDVALAGGGGGAGGADPGIRGFYGDAFDAELGARDLGLQRNEPLPDLGRRRVDSHQRLAVFHGERPPRRGGARCGPAAYLAPARPRPPPCGLAPALRRLPRRASPGPSSSRRSPRR